MPRHSSWRLGWSPHRRRFPQRRERLRSCAASSLPGLLASPIRLQFVVTEFDPVMFERQAQQVLEVWSERHGQWPDFIRLMGHNHLTSTFHLNTDDDHLGVQMLRFMAGA